MGTAVAKQYLTLGDKPVVVYSLEAFQASPVIDEIILITDKDHIEYCWEKLVHPYGITKVTAVAPGGKERYESVWKALCLLCGKIRGMKLGLRPETVMFSFMTGPGLLLRRI